MSGPIATLDPATPKIPDELWRQSGTPIYGWLIRGWVAVVLIAGGGVIASVTGSVYAWALAPVGIAVFFAIPTLVESLVLNRLAAKVDSVEQSHDADKGHAVLDELRNNATVKMLAPHGWFRVQEGRVHLAVGDGRAAAKAFAEAERVSTHASDKYPLISARAHALVLAGDRKQARELLAKLRKADALSDLDHLNFGVVLLSEAGHNQEALGHLQQAREAFNDDPRVLAGLVLALQRCDRPEEAAALLGEAEAAVEASKDQLAQDLLKRAKKGLRPLLKAKQKRARKADKRVETNDADAPGAKQHKPKGKKGRKQARRDARKKAKADARREPEQAIAAATAEQAEAAAAAPSIDEHPSEAEHTEPESAEADATQAQTEGDAEAHDSDAESDDSMASDDESAADDESESDESAESDDESDSESQDSDDESDEAEVTTDAPASASTSSSTPTKPADKDEGIDLATLALEALGSGTRRELVDSEGGPSASGLRPIEPSSSSSMFRSALFDDPKPNDTGPSSSSSLFDLPKLDSVPTFAPPPKSSRGPVLPNRDEKPEPKPQSEAKPAPKPAAPSVTPPKLGGIPSAPTIPAAPNIPAAPTIPAPKPAALNTPKPTLDDGWGDLGDLDPFAAPVAAPTPNHKSDED